ncbi:MAG: L-histidine N(alpha)-methyltransferase [Longimicrobiales bacterium]
MKGTRSPGFTRTRPLESNQTERADILSALSGSPRRIPSRFFYDRHGSELFEAITRTEAYYPTRVEMGILHTHAATLARHMGAYARIVEFGTGSGAKTQILLTAADRPALYIPIDVACAQLHAVAADLRARYAGLAVQPVCADYTQRIDVPAPDVGLGRTVVFFPGSTIGNMEPHEALRFLRRLGPVLGDDGLLIIGVDRKKDRHTVELAYNDPQGITAAFNLNILTHVNRILGSNFDGTAFRHHAFYNSAAGRIEMHLISQRAQTVGIPDAWTGAGALELQADEPIVTEHSYKYDLEEFQHLASAAGLTPIDVLTDAGQRFAVHLLAQGGY